MKAIVNISEYANMELEKNYQLKTVEFFLTTFSKERDLKIFESMLRNKSYDATCNLLINTEEIIIKLNQKPISYANIN